MAFTEVGDVYGNGMGTYWCHLHHIMVYYCIKYFVVTSCAFVVDFDAILCFVFFFNILRFIDSIQTIYSIRNV